MQNVQFFIDRQASYSIDKWIVTDDLLTIRKKKKNGFCHGLIDLD